jgi:HEAT repeat protein
VLLDNLFMELLRNDGADPHLAPRVMRARRELAWLGSEATDFLAYAFRQFGEKKPADVVALDRIGTTLAELQAVKELAAVLADPKLPTPLRLAAVHALAVVPDAAARDALMAALAGDPAWEFRAASAEALQKSAGEPAVRAALVLALDDGDGFVRASAVKGLAPALDPVADAALLARLAKMVGDDPDPGARGECADALAIHRKQPVVVAALVKALRDRDSSVVEHAANALVKVSDKNVQLALVDALERAVKLRQDQVVDTLLVVLRASVGKVPKDINPDGWRKLIRAAND